MKKLEKIIYVLALVMTCVAFGCVLGHNVGFQQGIGYSQQCSYSGGVAMYIDSSDYWCQYP